MTQPRQITSYGSKLLETLLAAAVSEKIILFPQDKYEDPIKSARQWNQRCNGLKAAMRAEGHPMAKECSQVRNSRPMESATDPGTYFVRMQRADAEFEFIRVLNPDGSEAEIQLNQPTNDDDALKPTGIPAAIALYMDGED